MEIREPPVHVEHFTVPGFPITERCDPIGVIGTALPSMRKRRKILPNFIKIVATYWISA